MVRPRAARRPQGWRAFLCLGVCLTDPFRVAAFIDGFNLYHAVDKLHQPHLKWLDLRKLCGSYVSARQQLGSVFYFSAYATWLPDPYRRHRVYAAALAAQGVTAVMGRFKEKDSSCHACKARWKAHEEKESDVNVALYLLDQAYQDAFDTAFIVSNDSDLSPAVRMVVQRFPKKQVHILTPPGRTTSKDLMMAAGGPRFVRTIKAGRVGASLLPATLQTPTATIVRPREYDPPPGNPPQI